MDFHDMLVSSRRVEMFRFSVKQVQPMTTPGLQEEPSPPRLQVQFLYTTLHRIFVGQSSSTRSIDSLPSSSLKETRGPTRIHCHEDARKKLCREFDLDLLHSTDDEVLGVHLAPIVSKCEIMQGSMHHAQIASEIKLVGRRICQERKNQGLISLQVSIARVHMTYHHCKENTTTELVPKDEEIMVPVIGVERRVVSVQGEDNCSLCLEVFRVRSCISMPSSHVFHAKCLETWVQGRNKRSCPLCRYEMPTSVGSARSQICTMLVVSLLRPSLVSRFGD